MGLRLSNQLWENVPQTAETRELEEFWDPILRSCLFSLFSHNLKYFLRDVTLTLPPLNFENMSQFVCSLCIFISKSSIH